MPPVDSTSGARALLFDVDGTLVDTLSALIPGLGDAYEQFIGFRPSEAEIRNLIGMPLRVQMRLFQQPEPSDERVAEMAAFAIQRFEAYKDREREFAPSVEALRLLHRNGYKTALVTSKSDVELASFLTRFAASDAVDTTVCASDVENPKPSPDSAFLACERLGVSPREAVFIGDSIYDMQCARSAGIATIAVSYGSSAEEALLAEHPDHLIRSPEQLLEWAHGMMRTSCLERS